MRLRRPPREVAAALAVVNFLKFGIVFVAKQSESHCANQAGKFCPIFFAHRLVHGHLIEQQHPVTLSFAIGDRERAKFAIGLSHDGRHRLLPGGKLQAGGLEFFDQRIELFANT
jgi:hypothetical protein